MTMNQFGADAEKHWKGIRAEEYALIEDPTRYFTELGERIAAEIERRTNEQERQQKAGQSEDFMANLAGLNNVAMTVRDDVMREMAFTEPGTTM
ncbi:hypothetical protein [Amycolatopsis coloradensis]|nr:hypothetical protein [Amycolatopsis coloradensis]